MNLPGFTPQLTLPAANIEHEETPHFWHQCLRAYTWQPIYKTNGRLMAMELLTIVTHPDNPARHLAPERYFSAVSVCHRVLVIKEQLRLLATHSPFFKRHDILASVNIDGPTLLALHDCRETQSQIAALSWLRFELVEHMTLPQNATFAEICHGLPLWLDDFGTGMANFSALSAVRYDHIKMARELFSMLRQIQEGRLLFNLLLELINRYCRGVIVEGIEKLDEWREVQASPACAAQGYFLARPVPSEKLENILINLV